MLTCLTVRAMCKVPKLDTDSCLNAIMLFIARSSESIKHDQRQPEKLRRSRREFKEHVAAWNRQRIEEQLVLQMEVQSTYSTLLRRSVRTSGQKLQESNVCIVGKRINYWRCSFKYNVSCWANIECKTIDTSQFWRKRFGSYYIKSLFAG